MGWFGGHSWLKKAIWGLGALLGVAVLLPLSLYIPAVSNWVADKACEIASEKTGMDITVGDVDIDFPLNVSIDDLKILDENGDTMLVASHVDADVAVGPLLRGEVCVNEANLTRAKYKMATDDESMNLNVDVDKAHVKGANIALNDNTVNVADAQLHGGKVNLNYDSYKSKPNEDKKPSAPWKVKANHITLDDIDYGMEMKPTVDRMKAHVKHAELREGKVDTGAKTVDVKSLNVDSADVEYEYPSAEAVKQYNDAHPDKYPDKQTKAETDGGSWKINGEHLNLTNSRAKYAKTGHRPGKPDGDLDMDYIEADNINLKVENFHNEGSHVKVPVKSMSARERSGLEIKEGSGTVEINDDGIDLDKVHIKTKGSDLNLSGHVDSGVLKGEPAAKAQLETDSKVSLREVEKIVPSLRGTLKDVPHKRPVLLKGSVSGNQKRIDVKNLDANIPGYAKAKARGTVYSPMEPNQMRIEVDDLDAQVADLGTAKFKGTIEHAGNPGKMVIHAKMLDANLPGKGRVKARGTISNITDMDHMKADLDMEGELTNGDFISDMLPKSARSMLRIPRAQLRGHIGVDNGKYTARNLRLTTGGGVLQGDATFDSKRENYDLDLCLTNFPVKSFLPSYDVTNLTGCVDAKGHGFDFTRCSSFWVDADVDLGSVRYNGATYRNLRGAVQMRNGYATANVVSNNEKCDVDVAARGTFCDDHYVFTADGVIRDLDVAALGFYDGTCQGRARFHADGDLNLRTQVCDADILVNDLDWQLDSANFVAEQANAHLHSTPGSTCFTFENEENIIHLNAEESPRKLINDFQNVSDELKRQVNARFLNMETIKGLMPKFDVDLRMGTDGLVQRYLSSEYELDFRQARLWANNDSNLNVDASVLALAYGNTNIDTLTLSAREWNKYLTFKGHMGNRRGTWDEFAQVDVEGGVKGSTVDFLATQRNIKRQMGYRVGVNATLDDNFIDMRFFPQEPVIGYRKWTLNDSNFLNFNYKTRLLDADLHLESDSSLLSIYTQRRPGNTEEDVFFDVRNLRLEEWVALVPALEETKGVMNADFDLVWDGTNVEGVGEASIDDFVYNGVEEGDVSLKTTFAIDPKSKSTQVDADIMADGRLAATFTGALNDANQASPLGLGIKLNRFPLSKANPFIPGGYVWLDGYGNGNVKMSGTMGKLKIEGTLTPDSARLLVPQYSCSLRLSEQAIPISNSRITFNQYKILGYNDQAVYVNGYCDMSDLNNMIFDLSARGRNVQFIDTEQNEVGQMFGKGYANLDATVKTRGKMMVVTADAKLLAGSRLTYVMKDDVTRLGKTGDKDMVTFTSFTDDQNMGDVAVTGGEESTGTNVRVDVDVEEGSTIGAYLNEDGQNRAVFNGSGKLRYTLDFAGKDNLTGTYTIENGNVRYTPPLISQKNFDLTSGSTVVFTGDMLNPSLNISGSEKVKTSVSNEDGGSRLVEFVITAKLGGTLENMDIDFDLESPGDMEVANELQSMSAQQRSQCAINLLLYNTYSGTNSAGNINNLTASTALYTFLQSQLNAWAAKSIPGVELSFGINQYEGTLGGSVETSYSYRLAKRLFNDRVKIVIGGEYNTDETEGADIASNLFNDVSLEYMLNSRGTRYVRLFRKTAFENVLEGQVTSTGVGFVMKRKLGNLRNLFKLRHSKEYLLRDSLEREQEERIRIANEAMDAIQDKPEAKPETFVVPLDKESTKPEDE